MTVRLNNRNLKLRNISNKLRLYDGTEMNTLGVTTLPCFRGHNRLWIEFIVINQDRQPILGAETCLQEGLIHIPVINSINHSTKEDLSL